MNRREHHRAMRKVLDDQGALPNVTADSERNKAVDVLIRTMECTRACDALSGVQPFLPGLQNRELPPCVCFEQVETT